MYQRCPICNGLGEKENPEYLLENESKICDVCNGTRIIHTVTGLPPDFEKNRIERERQEELARQGDGLFYNSLNQFP